MDEVTGWLDVEAQAALGAIRGAEAAKKRATVILLASAAAADTAWARVFEDARACNQRIWYQKWQKVPAIAHALEVCTGKALAFRDAETARVESQALQARRRAIAQGSLDAVQGLRITALNREDRADHRTDASALLLALADDELAARVVLVKKGTPLPVEVEGLDALIERELETMAARGEDDAVSAVAESAGEFYCGWESGADRTAGGGGAAVKQ